MEIAMENFGKTQFLLQGKNVEELRIFEKVEGGS